MICHMLKRNINKKAQACLFANIGRVDELGSGVRNLYKYTKIYAGGAPVLFEDDIFNIEISLEKSIEAENADKINESADNRR